MAETTSCYDDTWYLCITLMKVYSSHRIASCLHQCHIIFVQVIIFNRSDWKTFKKLWINFVISWWNILKIVTVFIPATLNFIIKYLTIVHNVATKVCPHYAYECRPRLTGKTLKNNWFVCVTYFTRTCKHLSNLDWWNLGFDDTEYDTNKSIISRVKFLSLALSRDDIQWQSCIIV